jgi:toxin ParE1/3/4
VTIKYDASAIEDLRQIWRYYAENAGPESSERFLRRIMSTLEGMITKHPHVGRRRLELGTDIRSFPIVPYVVFYRADRRTLYIIRILHGHRDIHPPLASLLLVV